MTKYFYIELEIEYQSYVPLYATEPQTVNFSLFSIYSFLCGFIIFEFLDIS